MSNIYEDTLLRKEFELVQKLQNDDEFKKYVTVHYEDRVTGQKRSVLSAPTGNRYPEVYFVDYRMPVYVCEGKKDNNYQATAKLTLSCSVLETRTDQNGPGTIWKSNIAPFNFHLSGTDSICKGNAWFVAKDLGLWFYIISLGALVNQDEFVCDDSGSGHYSTAAYQYWKSRGKKPVTNIKWPLDLHLKRSKMKIKKMEPEPTTSKKIKITRL